MEKISSKYFLTGCLIIIIMVFVIATIVGKNQMRSAFLHSKYTVGTMTSNWHQKNNNGIGTDFIYMVDGTVFSKTSHSDLRKGDKYMVLYDSLKPSVFLLLYNHKLPAHLEAPPNGWKFSEIPISLDSSDLKVYIEELDLD